VAVSEAPDAVDALMMASRALVGVAARSLAQLPSDLTLPQFRALVLISIRGPLATGELAESLGIHASTATRLVDRLELKGLVARGAVNGDRRTITLNATRRGERLVERSTAIRRKELERIVARLSPADRAFVSDALQRFAAVAGEAGDDSWTLGWTGT
jgi:DNA-binding MarR family transcriptional regulator